MDTGRRRDLENHRVRQRLAGRLAALDLDRFGDARELLGNSSGWDTGVAVHSDPVHLVPDLRHWHRSKMLTR